MKEIQNTVADGIPENSQDSKKPNYETLNNAEKEHATDLNTAGVFDDELTVDSSLPCFFSEGRFEPVTGEDGSVSIIEHTTANLIVLANEVVGIARKVREISHSPYGQIQVMKWIDSYLTNHVAELADVLILQAKELEGCMPFGLLDDDDLKAA